VLPVRRLSFARPRVGYRVAVQAKDGASQLRHRLQHRRERSRSEVFLMMRSDAALQRCRAARLLLAAVVLPAACDVPTGLPRLEPRFVLPLEGTSIPVSQLLPAGVIASGDVFRLALAPTSARRSLGEICGSPCASLHGQVAPKPAFTGTVTGTVPLPAGVAAAVLASGSVTVAVSHSFDFDPLRPQGSTTGGTLQAVVRSGSRQLGTTTIDQAFPRGTQLLRTIQLTPGELAGPVEVQVTLQSPTGDPAAIDTAALLTVQVAPGAIDVAAVTASVTNRQVGVQPFTLDLTRVEEELRRRTRGGTLALTLANPFGVTGELELRLLAPQTGTDLRRPVQVAPGTTTQRLALSEQELHGLLGARVEVTLAGPLGTAAPVVLQPGQELGLTTRLELTLEIGS
jgi:hypothetical protein